MVFGVFRGFTGFDLRCGSVARRRRAWFAKNKSGWNARSETVQSCCFPTESMDGIEFPISQREVGMKLRPETIFDKIR